MNTFKKYNQLGEEEEPWVGRLTRAMFVVPCFTMRPIRTLPQMGLCVI